MNSVTESPLVSVIMPVYNAAPYIGAAIQSVLEQTHTRLELIVVNDGSTDSSESIIKSFADPRIRYFRQENNGQAAASNIALSLAKGDYIKFFDADDVMNTCHLREQVKRLDGRVNALASCAWGRFYNEDPVSAEFIPETVWKDMTSLDWIKAAMAQSSDMMPAWLWMIPKKIIEKAGGWDERLTLNNDFEFSMRLLLCAEKVLFTERAKLHYRSGIQSLSIRKRREDYSAALLSTQLGCKHLLRKEDSILVKELCANRYQQWIYRIYPDYPDLIALFQREVSALAKPSIKAEGGKVFLLLCKMVGWKVAKRSQQFFYSLGYAKGLSKSK